MSRHVFDQPNLRASKNPAKIIHLSMIVTLILAHLRQLPDPKPGGEVEGVRR